MTDAHGPPLSLVELTHVMYIVPDLPRSSKVNESPTCTYLYIRVELDFSSSS